MRKLFFFLGVFWCLVNGFAQEKEYVIEGRDTLYVSAENIPELNGKVNVSPKGTLSLPLLGEIEARGLTLRELSQKIETLLKEYYFLETKIEVRLEGPSLQAQPSNREYFPMLFSEIKPASTLDNQKDTSGQEPPIYRIAPYDTIQISVYGEPELSVEVKVNEQGFIRYAFLGEIKVAGLTATEAAKSIEELLKKGYLVNPRVNVSISEHGKISILGEVIQPGSYELKGPLTLMDAIVLAGGLKEEANPSRIKVIRTYREDKSEPIKEYIVDLNIHGKSFYLYPLDKIIVEKYGLIFIVGAVKKPGAFKLERPDLTPLDAIIFLAGGALENANLANVTVVREKEERKEYALDLSRQEKGDFFLWEGDRIIVRTYKDISIFGEVRRPGAYPYRAGMTVTEAISLAGGFTDLADTNAVRVIKEGQKKKAIKVPVGYILKSGDKSRDIPLEDGDTIVVPESWF